MYMDIHGNFTLVRGLTRKFWCTWKSMDFHVHQHTIISTYIHVHCKISAYIHVHLEKYGRGSEARLRAMDVSVVQPGFKPQTTGFSNFCKLQEGSEHLPGCRLNLCMNGIRSTLPICTNQFKMIIQPFSVLDYKIRGPVRMIYSNEEGHIRYLLLRKIIFYRIEDIQCIFMSSILTKISQLLRNVFQISFA